MKHQWHSRRALVVTPDAQQRWDRVYQSLLAWGQQPALPRPSQEDQKVRDSQDSQDSQEGSHARSGVCARLDAEPGAHADH
jgi:hypothetical protein